MGFEPTHRYSRPNAFQDAFSNNEFIILLFKKQS